MGTALGAIQPACSQGEQELVAAVRRGSDEAFEELYSRYRAQIGSYILGMVHDHARAEDVSQEVFISALRGLRDSERSIAFKPWLYEIAKNACIDEFRRSRRVREVPLETGPDDLESGSDPVLAGGPTPDAAVENKQRLSDLRGAFHGLSDNHHRIIVMRELEGLSYSQIAEQLGMSKAVVESTLFRARRKLGEEYDELVSGRRCERIQAVIDAGGERPLRSLGLRDRRQLARHLSHCQPCRRHARMAGVDDSFFNTPGIIGKIAALLPFPWLRSRRSGGDGDGAAASGSHQLSALQSLPGLARLADPAAPAWGLGRATAAVAAIVLAGAGGGLVAGLGSTGHSPAGHAGAAGHSARSAPPRAATSSRVRKSSAAGAFAPSRVKLGGGSGGAGGASGGGGGGSGAGAGGSGSAGGGSRSGARSSAGRGSMGSTGAGRNVAGSKPVSGTAGRLGSTLHNVGAGAGSIVNGATSAVNGLATGATGAVNGTVNGATGVVNGAVNGATGVVNGTVQGATGAVNGIVNQATGAVNGITGALNRATNGATAPLTGAVNGAAHALTGATSGATGAVNSATTGATGAVNGAVGGATGAVNGAAGGASGAVNGAVHGATGAVNGITSAVGGALPKIP